MTFYSGKSDHLFRILLLATLIAVSSQAAAAADPAATPTKVFPYPIHKKTLANGLDVVVIETPEFKNVVSYNTLVLAGARNELEKGKTGLAHLFEHILFRHAYRGEPGAYEELMSRLGTHNNAWTWFDVTFYHPLSFTDNLDGRQVGTEQLPGLIELESARFVSLAFDEKIFKTETGAVLGEYRRNSTFPTLKMGEQLLALAFPDHPYGHETIGYYEDVLDMPNHYQAARAFYDTYYRPNNCVVVIAGDIRVEEIFTEVEPYYRDWQPKPVPPIPAASPLQGPKREHVPWPADVAPRLHVAYRVPAFRTGTVETAVGQLLGELLVSRSASLYKKLRFEKQTASELGLGDGIAGFESFDPRLIILDAQLFKEQYEQRRTTYLDEVIADIEQGVEELKRFSRQKGAQQLLENLKSKYRYDFLAAMASPAQMAQNLAWYYRFERDPEVFEKLLASVARLQPKDIDAFARKYFTPENQVVITLAYEAAKTNP
ncbi:MAG: insulinase family protein [Acidobacteria bacterium]|nr:insulinase family protein [Acidobacteriota bacterium]